MITHSLGLQILGYTASLIIATSLLMRSIVRLRLINLIGAATFSVYGFLIGAYPVGILNLLTTSINIVQLVRLQRRREIFRILEISRESPYLRYFLHFQADDIRRFYPRFSRENFPKNKELVGAIKELAIKKGVTVGQVALAWLLSQGEDVFPIPG